LGLATPIAIMVSTGVAAKNKILLKDAATFEMLHSVTTAVLDKTGTITKGELRVDKVCEFSPEFKTVLGSFEKQSNHPLAVAVSSYLASENVPITTPENFVTVAGKGIEATLDGVIYRCGNAKFVEEWGISAGKVDTEGGSVIFAASKEKLLGYVTITDTVKETSKSAIEAFRKMGIKTVILTGDNKASGEKVRREVNADEVIADVLPIEKAQHVKALKEKGEKVLMVGDGINDAVALETADVGMAIGAGSDIAVESANIVLVRSDLSDAVRAIELSHKTIRNIRMNLFWAFFYNAIAIPVAMGLFIYPFGIKLTPMIASAAMSFSSVFVVLNSLRLMNALKKRS